MKLKYYLRGLGIGVIVTAILLSVSLHKKPTAMSDEEIKARAKELGMEEKYETTVLADGVSENSASEEQLEEIATDEIKTDDKQAVEEIKTDDEQVAVKEQDAEDTTEVAKEEVTNPAGEKLLNEADDLMDETMKQADETMQKADETVKKADESLEQIKSDVDADKLIDDASNIEEIQTDTELEKTDKAPIETKPVEEAKSDKEYKITVASGDGSMTVAKKLKEAGVIKDAAAYDRFLCQNGYDKKICVGVHTFHANDDETQIAKNLTSKAK